MTTAEVSIPAYLAVIFICIFFVSAFIVVYYAEEGFPYLTYITLTVGYFSSFAILFLVPLDIAVVVTDRRSVFAVNDPTYMNHVQTLSIAYSTFFNLILIFGSFVLVLEEYYNTDGYFTVASKITSSLYRCAKDTILGVVAGCIILGILLGQKIVPNSAAALQLAAVIVTNTIYETMLMFLLGYGLVEFPRSLWNMSDIDYFLRKLQMKASSDYKAISDAQLEVSLAVSDVIKTREAVTRHGDPELVNAIDILISECPPEFRSSKQGTVAANKQGQVTIDSLAALRLRLNVLKDRYRMAKAAVEGTKLRAYKYEDLANAKNRQDGVQQIHWSLTGQLSTVREYQWYIILRPLLFKFTAFVCGCLSLFSFLGVICSMDKVSNDVSVYFLAVHDPKATPQGILIFIWFSMGYAVYVAYWALFQIRVAGMMELVPYRTTPESLSFNVRMVARLAAPLAFFYLGWISENGIRSGYWTHNNAPSIHRVTNTSYTQVSWYNASYHNSSHITHNFTTEAVWLSSIEAEDAMYAPVYLNHAANNHDNNRVEVGGASIYNAMYGKTQYSSQSSSPSSSRFLQAISATFGPFVAPASYMRWTSWSSLPLRETNADHPTGQQNTPARRTVERRTILTNSEDAVSGTMKNGRMLYSAAATPTSGRPTTRPTARPTAKPSYRPTYSPTVEPTFSPTTFSPTTSSPTTSSPTLPQPTPVPTLSGYPTPAPSHDPHEGLTRRVSNYTIVDIYDYPGGIPMPSCFSHFYQLQVVKGLKTVFGTFFPVLLIVIIALVTTNILNRIFVLIRMPYLQFGAEIVTEEQLREGKRQLERNRRATERTVQRDMLKNHVMKLVQGDDGDGGIMGFLFGNRKAADARSKMTFDPQKPVLVEPDGIAGKVEKKSAGKFGMGGWKEMYAEVRTPGVLCFFKDQSAAAVSTASGAELNLTPAKGGSAATSSGLIFSLSLPLVTDFAIVQKEGHDVVHLDLRLTEETHKLRFSSLDEAEHWKEALIAWKDHAVDYAALYPSSQQNDLEAGMDGLEDGANAESKENTPTKGGVSGFFGNKGEKGKPKQQLSAFDELDNLQVDEEIINPMQQAGSQKKAAGGGSMFSSLFGGGAKKKAAVPIDELPPAAADVKPEHLEGWLDKKSGGKIHVKGVTGDWQRRYCRIDERSSSLQYFKTNNPSEQPSGVIELKMALDIRPYDKKGKLDMSRFNINMGEKVYKFRAPSQQEGERWVNGLNDWREYFLMKY